MGEAYEKFYTGGDDLEVKRVGDEDQLADHEHLALQSLRMFYDYKDIFEIEWAKFHLENAIRIRETLIKKKYCL